MFPKREEFWDRLIILYLYNNIHKKHLLKLKNKYYKYEDKIGLTTKKKHKEVLANKFNKHC
jgi:hypothetical protein